MRLCWHSWQRLDTLSNCRCRKCGREAFYPPRDMLRDLREKIRHDPLGLTTTGYPRRPDAE